MSAESEDQFPNESTASVEDSRDVVLEQAPRSLQHARDCSQPPLRHFITPVEASEPTRDPFLTGLSAMNGSSRRIAYEGSGPTSMGNVSTCPSPKHNRAFIPATDYPFQPPVIPTTAASIRDPGAEASVRVVFRNVGLDPWNLSLTAPDSHGRMLFPRAEAIIPHSERSGVGAAGCSRYLLGPQGLLSHDSYVRSSHDGAEVPPIGRGRDAVTQNTTWRRLPQAGTS